MVNEEFSWDSVSNYLMGSVTTAFVGPSFDERSNYFFNVWKDWPCQLVRIESLRDSKFIQLTVDRDGICVLNMKLDFITGLKSYLEQIRSLLTTTIIDLSSLQHPVIMYLTKLLLQGTRPKRLFATYAEPNDYLWASDSGEFKLSEELLGLRAVPGFARRDKNNSVRLVAMLGFEGDRLTKIVEDMSRISNVTPVIGFPSFKPGWQARSLQNCMRAIQAVDATTDIHKCKANSIFEAYKLLERLRPRDGATYAIAPLGTRPHSMASAIYATKNANVSLIYDHPVEVTPRSNGVFSCKCFHLTSFMT